MGLLVQTVRNHAGGGFSYKRHRLASVHINLLDCVLPQATSPSASTSTRTSTDTRTSTRTWTCTCTCSGRCTKTHACSRARVHSVSGLCRHWSTRDEGATQDMQLLCHVLDEGVLEGRQLLTLLHDQRARICSRGSCVERRYACFVTETSSTSSISSTPATTTTTATTTSTTTLP